MNHHRSVGLEHEQAHSRWQRRGETAAVGDGAASEDETHAGTLSAPADGVPTRFAQIPGSCSRAQIDAAKCVRELLDCDRPRA
jgi:hypothetical protein